MVLPIRLKAVIEVVDGAVELGDVASEVGVGLVRHRVRQGVPLRLEPCPTQAGPQSLWRSVVSLDVERRPPG